MSAAFCIDVGSELVEFNLKWLPSTWVIYVQIDLTETWQCLCFGPLNYLIALPATEEVLVTIRFGFSESSWRPQGKPIDVPQK